MNQVEAVIFDWAGTMVDFGSLAPVRAVTEIFARHGVAISSDDARRDMGIYKKDHIRRILQMPHVEQQWRERTGNAPDEKAVDTLFTDFQPAQMQVLASYSSLIPGAARIAGELRSRGLKIGSTTGYTRPMLDVLVASAAEQGYGPDLALCPDDAGGGRPLPWMCLTIALQFRISSVACAVKVGDTASDIAEGRNAGMWTVGVSRTGNEIGMSEADLDALASAEQARRVSAAAECLRSAGAHYVVEDACHIQPVLDDINARLAAGQRP
jgi:phosphonoacetaldehyde hydrolase